MCSVRLAYFHTNCLLIELYKQEMEIRCRKKDNKVKKETDIDRHGPKPSSNSSQPPNPPPFSLPTTFNPYHNHVNADPKQTSLHTTSRPLHHAPPKQNYCIKMYSCQYQLVKIINQKRVAYATNSKSSFSPTTPIQNLHRL